MVPPPRFLVEIMWVQQVLWQFSILQPQIFLLQIFYLLVHIWGYIVLDLLQQFLVIFHF